MGKMTRWKFYNRKFLVDPFQLRLVGVAVFHFVLVVLILAAALFTPVIIRLQNGDLSSPQVQAAANEFLVLHTRLWGPLFGAFVLLVLHNIVVTHRVAGPLFGIRRYLKSVGDGDLSSPVRVRNNDYLQKEAKVASEMVASLSDKIHRLEQQLERAGGAWRNLKNVLGRSTDHELETKISEMSEHLANCRAAVAVFRTANKSAPAVESTPEAHSEPAEPAEPAEVTT